MTDFGRRELLRMAAPAVALPMVATLPAEAKEQRLVTRDEIMDAFRFFDNMELRADDLNLRYQILIDMLFETNPESLRAKLNALIEGRKDHMVLLDACAGHTAPYDPSMYEAQGRLNIKYEQQAREQVAQLNHAFDAVEARERVEQNLPPRLIDNLDVAKASNAVFGGWAGSGLLPKPKLRTRIAAWLMGWRA